MSFKVIQPQPTIEAPYVVKDYPYGFRLRCEIHYYVETTKNGQRLVSQTINPKTGRLNKPKASTYSQIVLAALDEQEHVVNLGISAYSLEEAQKFQATYAPFLSEYQQRELTNIIKQSEVYSKVTYTIRTKRYKNLKTGEISTTVSMFDLGDVVEVNDFGDPVDEKADKAIAAADNRTINLMAIRNAAKETSVDEAIATFKRSA